MTDALKAEQSSRAAESTALDSLWERVIEVGGGAFEEQDDAGVMQATSRKLENLDKRLRDVQGRAALLAVKLLLEVGKVAAEVELLQVSNAQMSLELQVKGSEIDELQKEACLCDNQLLELVEMTTAARSSRDEAVK